MKTNAELWHDYMKSAVRNREFAFSNLEKVTDDIDEIVAAYRKRFPLPTTNLTETSSELVDWSQWQPPWEEAPMEADLWEMAEDEVCHYRVRRADGWFWMPAPDFGYKGPWQESMRRRPTKANYHDARNYDCPATALGDTVPGECICKEPKP